MGLGRGANKGEQEPTILPSSVESGHTSGGSFALVNGSRHIRKA